MDGKGVGQGRALHVPGVPGAFGELGQGLSGVGAGEAQAVDVDALRPYYEDLVSEFLPPVLRW